MNTFGLRGELKVKVLTEFPEIRFAADQQLYIEYDQAYWPVTVKSTRWHKEHLLVLFRDLEDINLVEKYKGCDIYISKDDVHVLPAGQYYYFELTGCDVYENNKCIGKVSSVEDGYQTLLRVQMADKEVLIPYVPAFIEKVDVSAGRIDINSIEGLL